MRLTRQLLRTVIDPFRPGVFPYRRFLLARVLGRAGSVVFLWL